MKCRFLLKKIRKQLRCALFTGSEAKKQTHTCFIADCDYCEKECQRKGVRNEREDLKSEKAIKST